MSLTKITETLATLSVPAIFATVVVLTLLRLGLLRLRAPQARSWAELMETLLTAFAFVFLILRPFLMQTNYIPSPSMVPTLQGKNGVGDHILVNKFLYRVALPQHDDIVVFIAPPEALTGNGELPSNDTEFIKRMIGRPGDIVEAVGGKVYVKDTAYTHSALRTALITHGLLGKAALGNSFQDIVSDHQVKFVPEGVLADGKLIPKSQLGEIITGLPNPDVRVEPGYTLLNGKRLNEPFIAEDPDYDLKIVGGKPLKFEFNTELGDYKWGGVGITREQYTQLLNRPAEPLPPHRVFMMGDNRNDSDDSTDWGPLDDSRIVGKAQAIFWPLTRLGSLR